MYTRFQTSTIDEASTKPTWPFSVIYDLRRSGTMTQYDLDYAASIVKRFVDNLVEPKKFSRKNKKTEATRWISRFKETAVEHINQMRELCRILEEYEIPIEVVKTDTPWYIIYEDDYQIVAEPFKQTL